ncbi:MAG TPA: hypothetical protein VFN52_01220 [Acidiferrobacteraceae bacterium]|nr:hypothetical protein [Acidiferrobacteraceae bacterium]
MTSFKKTLGTTLAAVCVALTLGSVQARADDGWDHGDHGGHAYHGDGDDHPRWHRDDDDHPRWRRDDDGEDHDGPAGFFGLTIGPVFSPPQPVYVPPPVPAPHYWYYCGPAQAYYPNVQSCPVQWQLVPSR